MKLCIDPGHGGSDSGGTGYGKQEKNVVLQIAYEVFHQASERGIQSILTRTKDVGVAIPTRYEIANAWGANLFMSIHTNASGGRGLEVLYGKSNAKAIALDLVKELHAATGWPIRRGDGLWYRPTGVGVLRGTIMPAVLSECGFIDYPEENTAMSNPEWIRAVARAHINTACNYFGITESVGGEDDEVKFYAEKAVEQLIGGWVIYNIPACKRDWYIDVSNEGNEAQIKVFANPQDKSAASGGFGEWPVPPTTAKPRPGFHAQLKDAAPGLTAEWSEVSIHASKELSILVGN